ncbi:MAG: helix-turn-helix domain-containing protein [Thermus sp.]|uniref:helix-turn-helix domain-containing protein n=1 Tax=Thermus sp. TaxID=275 RepID=UPI003919C642
MHTTQNRIEEQVEEIAQELAKTSRAYASHFRQVVHVVPPVDDLVEWLAGLSDEDIKSLAQKLQELEGKPRPHFTAAMKKARAIALGRREASEIPEGFAEALGWAIKRAGVSVGHLARLTGISRATIQDWLKGSSPTSKERIQNLEEALGLSPGTLVVRVQRWGLRQNRSKFLAGINGHYKDFGTIFLRLASLARYGKPFRDLDPGEKQALVDELRKRLGRLSNRMVRTAIASRDRFALPFADWPEGAKQEWEGYRVWAASRPGDHRAVLARLEKGSVPEKPVRPVTLELDLLRVERYFGFLVHKRGVAWENLSLQLLGDYEAVKSYLKWRWERFDQKGDLPTVTRTDEGFLAFILKLIRRGFVKAEPDRFRDLYKAVAKSAEEGDGFHSVLPLLEEPDPLEWIRKGIALMLQDLRERVGDLRNPSFEGMSKKEQDRATYLYRDALIWWAMAVHPLRARHWYGARFDPEGLGRERQEGNLYRDEAGNYYLLYRREEFKNAASSLFQHLGDRPVLFPLHGKGDIYRLTLGDTTLTLNELMDTYLRAVRPLLVRRKEDRALFPGITGQGFYYMFIRRSAYVIALPQAPEGLRPFGPHSMRHILATTAVKRTGSLEMAANLLLDSIAMVQAHYARFLPQDRYQWAHEAVHGRRP